LDARSGYLKPAFLGGLVTGVLSALPVVSAGNYCCCLWVVTGGLLSAWLLQQERGDVITAGDGAIVGLLAGVFGAVVQAVLSIPIEMVVGPIERQLMTRLSEMSGAGGSPLDFGVPGMIGTVILRVLAFIWTLVVGAIVSTIAGIVGAALFARPQAHPTPEPPPLP
jgi:hypothetical protein